MTRLRRIRVRLLVVFTTLVLLELVLQGSALLMWAFARNAGAALTSGERVVLCTGDSYTYGLGSSSPAEQSYPAQLEKILNQRSTRWRVANCGWPGQNSWDVLRRLDDQLRQFRPSLVYLLVGVNDYWGQPELHRLDAGSAASSDSFTWTWRTVRLLRLLRGMFLKTPRIAREAAQVSAAFPAGHWTYGGLPVHFAEDGRMTIGGTSLDWTSTGNELRISTGGSAEILARWSLAEHRLTLSFDAMPLVVVLEPRDSVLEGWAAWRAGELDKAESAFKEALAKNPEEPTIHAYLAMTYESAGRTKEVEEQLAFVRSYFHARRDDQAAVETCVGALASAGRSDEAVRLAKEYVTRFPESSPLWEVIANGRLAEGDSAGARDAVERAIKHASPSARKGLLYRMHVFMLMTVDPLEAARSAVLARVNQLDRNLTVQMLQVARSACTEENITQVCDELALSSLARNDIMELHRASLVQSSGPLEVWRAHMRQAIARCKAADAVPVIVTYPFPNELEAAMESLARDEGAGFVSLTAEFARATAAEGGASFCARDAHPNEKGYAIIARLVAEDVLRRHGVR